MSGRGTSTVRKLKRNGLSLNGSKGYDINTGRVIRRPFSNKANHKRKPTHHFANIFMALVTGKDGSTSLDRVDETQTVTYLRIVFPDVNGAYPEGAKELEVHHSGDPSSKAATYRTIMVVEDTKLVSGSTQRVNKN